MPSVAIEAHRPRQQRDAEWIVVGALAGHGVLDALHGRVLENSGAPVWWPPFCLACDLGAAASLAWPIKRDPKQKKPGSMLS